MRLRKPVLEGELLEVTHTTGLAGRCRDDPVTGDSLRLPCYHFAIYRTFGKFSSCLFRHLATHATSTSSCPRLFRLLVTSNRLSLTSTTGNHTRRWVQISKTNALRYSFTLFRRVSYTKTAVGFSPTIVESLMPAAIKPDLLNLDQTITLDGLKYNEIEDFGTVFIPRSL